MCFVLPNFFPNFLNKKMFFKRKHDFSWNLEGGTGLLGVSSNLNIGPGNVFHNEDKKYYGALFSRYGGHCQRIKKRKRYSVKERNRASFH